LKDRKEKSIALIIPTLTSGGAERVMATLANTFQEKQTIQVHLIVLTGGALFYHLHPKVQVYVPSFDYKKYSRIVFTFKIIFFLRNTLRLLKPDTCLSFGGKYNAFVLLSAIGLQTKVFVSDRSRPSISYGAFLNVLNPIVYRLAAGIVAQTMRAKDYLYKKTKHRNIIVIGNPIKEFNLPIIAKKKVILNVGRFIATKNQELLVRYFNEIATDDWELWFLGEGPLWETLKEKAAKSRKASHIHFFGNQKNVEDFYAQARIFAFTSISEGFPNALGEAMRAGCACIAYDCEAGPADLIENDSNGFLIPLGDHEAYKLKLEQLVKDSTLRSEFSKHAKVTIAAYNEEKIAMDFLYFLT